MRRLVTGEQMKEIDSYAIHTIGIPSMVLMERAALCVADEMEQAFSRTFGRGLCTAKTAVFCGTGNNGADGACADPSSARMQCISCDSGGSEPLDAGAAQPDRDCAQPGNSCEAF